MYFTAHHGVISMDKVVYQSFEDGAVGIVGEVKAIVWHLHPATHGIVFDEIHTIF